MTEIIIEFEATFKKEKISGYLNLQDADDEKPLHFYTQTGAESWYIPKNPNDPELQHEWWCDYDYLKTVFQENDIVGILCDCEGVHEILILEETENDGPVVLKIWG